MKKRNLFVLSVATLSMVAIAGCGTTNNSSNREAELEEKITKLEQQIATLESEKAANTTDTQAQTEGTTTDANGTVTDKGTTDNNTATNNATTNNTTNNDTTNHDTTNTNTTNTAKSSNYDASTESIESLEKEVDKVVKKIEAATPSKDTEKKRTEFFTLKDEANAVEDRLDVYEDYLEEQYKQGTITYEEYRKKEKELDTIEEKLDKAEDKLESNYGMED